MSFSDRLFIFVIFVTRQEQEGWQTASISEDLADATSSRQELGLTTAHVRQREQQDGQEGKD